MLMQFEISLPTATSQSQFPDLLMTGYLHKLILAPWGPGIGVPHLHLGIDFVMVSAELKSLAKNMLPTSRVDQYASI